MNTPTGRLSAIVTATLFISSAGLGVASAEHDSTEDAWAGGHTNADLSTSQTGPLLGFGFIADPDAGAGDTVDCDPLTEEDHGGAIFNVSDMDQTTSVANGTVTVTVCLTVMPGMVTVTAGNDRDDDNIVTNTENAAATPFVDDDAHPINPHDHNTDLDNPTTVSNEALIDDQARADLSFDFAKGSGTTQFNWAHDAVHPHNGSHDWDTFIVFVGTFVHDNLAPSNPAFQGMVTIDLTTSPTGDSVVDHTQPPSGFVLPAGDQVKVHLT